VAGTRATSDDGSWYSTYDGWVVASTRATTIDCGPFVQSWICPVLRLRRLIVGGNVSYDRSTASVLIEREATMVVLMRTMVYGPSKLCGTNPTVWAIDGTSAIGCGIFVVEFTEGNGGCKRHTIGLYVAKLRPAMERIKMKSLRS